jgi:hypothetical protein
LAHLLLAVAEDRSVFDGYAAAGIQGVRQGSSNPALTLPSNARGYPGAVAQAVTQLRLAGVNGPWCSLLGRRRRRWAEDRSRCTVARGPAVRPATPTQEADGKLERCRLWSRATGTERRWGKLVPRRGRLRLAHAVTLP